MVKKYKNIAFFFRNEQKTAFFNDYPSKIPLVFKNVIC